MSILVGRLRCLCPSAHLLWSTQPNQCSWTEKIFPNSIPPIPLSRRTPPANHSIVTDIRLLLFSLFFNRVFEIGQHKWNLGCKSSSFHGIFSTLTKTMTLYPLNYTIF
ncbi:hypothetical protein OUZ56_032758 [Daphnia magna]|uniref:Uncharacterized protein n=1 Tax=Daphnia magna TaxID=35525 RepID=A0ABQ9ZX18_9CRUS|nr:hypothetical protein OUZ56_032758 [Daphnia magna]